MSAGKTFMNNILMAKINSGLTVSNFLESVYFYAAKIFKNTAQDILSTISNTLFSSRTKAYSKGVSDDNVVSFERKSAAKSSSKSDSEVAEVFDKYGNSILRLAYSYLHNMDDSEDILQETLIRYMKKAPAFESPEHEKAWLLRVAMNLSKNKIDYNKVRKTDELNDELVAEERKDLSFVWEAVKALPEKQRVSIHLFYEEGYSTKDISNIMNENESTVRSHLRRGREKLKEILREEYDFG